MFIDNTLKKEQYQRTDGSEDAMKAHYALGALFFTIVLFLLIYGYLMPKPPLYKDSTGTI